MNTQTEVKHTPGPWGISKCSDSREIISNACGITFRIAIAESGLGRANGDNEAKANARLIAAAPALLEAVKNVPFMWSEQDNKDVIIARFWDWWETWGKPSIDKAEGRI